MTTTKALGCVSLKCANAIIGLWQWLIVCGAIALLVIQFNTPLVTTGVKYELPLMLLAAYTVPAFLWFGSSFSPKPSVHRCYSIAFFVCHILVETYLLVLPILYYASQWSST